MRLSILDRGHGLGTKALFAFIRAVSRQPTPEALKLIAYRPEFYGDPMKKLTHAVMRGPSSWSVGDRELMAATIATATESEYCIKAHTAVSTRAYGDAQRVSAALADPDAAPIEAPLRATLHLLRKLVRERSVNADDLRAVLHAGATREQIEDALGVAFTFNVMSRLANAFGFEIGGPNAFEAGAKFLLARGYK